MRFARGIAPAQAVSVNRRIAIVLAALIVPGGLVALFGAVVVKAFSRTDAGRKAWDRMANLLRRPVAPAEPVRQAA
jgi:hypothetical protein